jgi:hypothetical protein
MTRFCLTGLVMLAELAHLAWEHFHGGIVRHHLLHRADMPAISNGWGLLLLPALTWFLIGRIQRRTARHADGSGVRSRVPVRIAAGFAGALVIGILLSAAFARHHESVATYLFLIILLLAVILPVYRAECVLGFVLGMTLTFGGVLPTMVAAIIAAVSAAIHLLLRPGLARLWVSFKGTRSRGA